jgi:restriction system protein
VVERGRQDVADGNIDLDLRRGSDRRLVQCKRWTATWVGVDEIRKFAGTLAREKLPSSAGIFVTLSDFTQQATAESKQLDMVLMNKRELHARIEKVRRVEPCPKCSSPMVLDRSVHGWWFRCTLPDCGGKRDLSKDAGRAIAMITDER